MSSHVDRMEKEFNELNTKINALSKFIHVKNVFQTLDYLEQIRMIKQLGYMQAYADVLNTRLEEAE